jgi:hypothetical protein
MWTAQTRQNSKRTLDEARSLIPVPFVPRIPGVYILKVIKTPLTLTLSPKGRGGNNRVKVGGIKNIYFDAP